jgi:hypothetical protein
MLSYGYWQRHFGGDLSVIGLGLAVDSLPRQIVGVMPKGFRVVKAEPDLILPLAFDRGRVILAGFGFKGIRRLKPGVTIAQASADRLHSPRRQAGRAARRRATACQCANNRG